MALADFITSYRGREAQMNAAPAQELAQMGALQGILARAQAAQEQKQLQGVIQQAGGDPAKAVQALIASGNPKAIEIAARLQSAMPKPDRGQPIGSGGLLMPDRTVIPPAPRPGGGAEPTRLEKYMTLYQSMPEGDPRKQIIANAIRKESETAKQISPTVVMPRPEQPPVAVMGQDGKPVFVNRAEAIGKTPAVKETADRVIPANIAKAYTENATALRKIDSALAEVEKYPAAFGLQNVRGDAISQRLDPKGVTARAIIADIGSLKIHDRSGAAVTAAETPRLLPFIPNVNDKAETIKKKLALFRKEYAAIQTDIDSMYNAEQGYRALPGAKSRATDTLTVDELLNKYK